MKTDITFAADGSVSGTTTTTGRGRVRDLAARRGTSFGEDRTAAALTLLRQHGTPGTGTFSFDPPTAPGDEYTVRGTFQFTISRRCCTEGSSRPGPAFGILPRPGDVLGGPMFLPDLSTREPTFCYPGIESEELSITLPKGRVLGGLASGHQDRFRPGPLPLALVDDRSARHRYARVPVARDWGRFVRGRCGTNMADELAKIRADLLNPIGIQQDVVPGPAIGFAPARQNDNP